MCVDAVETSSSRSMRTQSHPLESSVNRPRVEWEPQHTSTRRLVKRPCVETMVVVHSAGRLVRFSLTQNLWAMNESSWEYEGPVEHPKIVKPFSVIVTKVVWRFLPCCDDEICRSVVNFLPLAMCEKLCRFCRQHLPGTKCGQRTLFQQQ